MISLAGRGKAQSCDLPGRLVEGALFCCGWMSLSRLLPGPVPLRLSLCLIEENIVL